MNYYNDVTNYFSKKASEYDLVDEQLYWVLSDELAKRFLIDLLKENKETITNIHAYMDELFFSFESPNQSFTHGNLQPKNIIISNGGKIEGVIDFSDSRIGSCELDFCHILYSSESLCKKAIEMYLGKYDQGFFERVFFLSRRNVIFEIDNDDIYNNSFDKIYQHLIKSKFLSL